MRIVPPLDFIDTKSSAERLTARVLRDIKSDDGVAYHSVHLPRHRKQVMGEADFVVLWKGAVVVLEVKGGRIGRSPDGVWYSLDRYDRAHDLSRSPWVQAKDAGFALMDILRAHLSGGPWPFAYAVVTPDQNLDPDVEWTPEQHIGLSQMSPRGMERALDKLSRQARTVPGSERDGARAVVRSASDLSDVAGYLRREVDAVRTLPDAEQLIDRTIVEMTNEQVDAMRAFERNRRVLVLGGAGTGKTVVAVEAARRAAEAKRRTAFLCDSAGVREDARTLLADASVEVLSMDQLPDEPTYEVLVVDEAQDLMNLEDMARVGAALRGGLDEGMWWIFLDPNNQAHLVGAFKEEVFHEVQESAFIVDLTRNVRNARNVVTSVQSHLGADLGSPRIGEGPKAAVVRTENRTSALDRLNARLRELRADEVARRHVTIVSAAVTPEDSVLAVDGGLPPSYAIDGRSYEVTTAARIKGRERAHVIVVDVDDLDVPSNRAATYVAMTRPRYSLYVVTSLKAYEQMGRHAVEFLTAQQKGGAS